MTGGDSLTVARLRASLADTTLPREPTRVVLPPHADRMPQDMLKRLTRALRPAAVLIPVIERKPHLSVLLTRRSAELTHHASQIAFPGGRMDPDDTDIEQTALRETAEEVGIAAEAVSVIGYLEPMPTVTGYAVTPVVGVIEPPVDIVIDRREVDVAFEVPLPFLFEPDNARHTMRPFRGSRIPTVEFHFGGHRIWGATANMLVSLRDKVINNK
ncbi:MAG: CoA pyrophosphatase [Woeseiaceae bacterium]|nr:CoA pyrophosphatase [Woeseiaceae bacterium]